MRRAGFQLTSGGRLGRVRERLPALLFVIAIHIGLGFMLWTLAPPEWRKKLEPMTRSFEVRAIAEPKTQKAAPKAPPKAAPEPPRPRIERPRIEPPKVPPLDPDMRLGLQMSESFDLAKLPQRAPVEVASAGGTGGEGQAEAAGEGPGEGPGGVTLYNADWQREPTAAELSGYIRPGMPRSGYGIIACRTVAGFRVEDCVEVSESPPGSGFATAVREAAWQFRVRPPRAGNRTLVGAWVRIRITYTQGEVTAGH